MICGSVSLSLEKPIYMRAMVSPVFLTTVGSLASRGSVLRTWLTLANTSVSALSPSTFKRSTRLIELTPWVLDEVM